MRPRPRALQLAAAVQALEAAGVFVATAMAGLDTAAGRSYQQASGIALTVIGLCAAAALAATAAGLAKVRRWARTPALLTQLFVGITAVYLLEGHRLDWGVPALLLALAGSAGLLLPGSLRALVGPKDGDRGGEAAAQQALPARQPTPRRR
ncbi:MAG TPA: hypothetical protein VE733_19130 [Streptosporangiaceae bacterium]|nr:hypothetical protein [Streptosporangiaceae bacterium]